MSVVEKGKEYSQSTYIFDIWTWIDSDDIAMLHPEVMTNNAIHPRTAIIKVIFSKDNQNCVLPLFAFDENCVATEKPQGFHGVVGKADDRIIIVDGIGNTVEILATILKDQGAMIRGKLK